MNIRADIRSRQVQSIAISAQAIQTIKILQFGFEDLQAFVAEQVERNPVIRLDEARGDAVPVVRENAVGVASQATEAGPGNQDSGGRNAGLGMRTGDRNCRAGSELDGVGFEDLCSVRLTLRDHLHAQVALSFRDPVDRAVAVQIVEAIDADGYLRRRLHEIADLLSVPEEQVAAVLAGVQRFDPIGVGARSLAECLQLQLDEAGHLDPAMSKLLDNLPLLASFEIGKLARICGVGRDEVLAMAKVVRRLDPKPGRRYDEEPMLPALPDVLVSRRGEDFVVEMNPVLLPKVLIDREYVMQVRRSCSGEEERSFVADCLKSANWLARSLDQRAGTILRVATEIVSRQKAFFDGGVEELKPLNLRDVAETVGVHVSTVCRAVSGKYLLTDKGMFELNYFFANAISAVGGEDDFATASIQHKIRHMIGAETSDRVLSDDAIVDELRRHGVDIARRTIAKYRETMNIPSSLQRRRQMQAHAC